MATIKLKDAYYSVNIDGDDTCFLKFLSNWKLFNFVFLPNGLSQSPPKFTKLIMSPLAMLRMQGYTVAIYIDDIIPIDQSFEECLLTVVGTINLFQKLSFVIHPCKSKFLTSQNSGISWFYYWLRKSDNLSTGLEKITIPEFASFTGTLTSSCQGNQLVWSNVPWSHVKIQRQLSQI